MRLTSYATYVLCDFTCYATYVLCDLHVMRLTCYHMTQLQTRVIVLAMTKECLRGEAQLLSWVAFGAKVISIF